jgi:hypothetical protein
MRGDLVRVSGVLERVFFGMADGGERAYKFWLHIAIFHVFTIDKMAKIGYDFPSEPLKGLENARRSQALQRFFLSHVYLF